MVAAGVGDRSVKAAPHGDATTKTLEQRCWRAHGAAASRTAGGRVPWPQRAGRASGIRRGEARGPSYPAPGRGSAGTEHSASNTAPRREVCSSAHGREVARPAPAAGERMSAWPPRPECHAAFARADVPTHATTRTDFEDVTPGPSVTGHCVVHLHKVLAGVRATETESRAWVSGAGDGVGGQRATGQSFDLGR